MSTDEKLFEKDISALTGCQRNLEDIVIVDTVIAHYTHNLTNGVFMPVYVPSSTLVEDKWLLDLSDYLNTLGDTDNCKERIRTDFKLEEMFNECKQNKAVAKRQELLAGRKMS